MKRLSRSLVIDTASRFLFIALCEGNRVLDQVYRKGHNDHSVTLMAEMDALFTRQDLKPSELDRIIVGVGPGSYTGIRVGVVVAKMLGWTLDKPVYTVSSLAVLASGARGDGKVLAWLDARRGQGFMGIYLKRDGELSQVEADRYGDVNAMKETFSYDVECVEGLPDVGVLLDSDLLSEVEDIHRLSPVYLRVTEAERQLGKGS